MVATAGVATSAGKATPVLPAAEMVASPRRKPRRDAGLDVLRTDTDRLL